MTQQLAPDSFWITNFPCVHRSIVPETTGECNLCGIQGQTFLIYSCFELGECSLLPRHDKVPHCKNCLKQKTPTSQEQQQRDDELRLLKIKPAVGITTSPRNGEYILPECTRTLLQAGAENITIFAEPDSNLTSISTDVKIEQRSEQLGAWGNWKQTARDLLETTNEELILIVQDDTVFSIHAMIVEWPNGPVGFVSLYTPAHYQRCWKLFSVADRLLGTFPSKSEAIRESTRFKGSDVREYHYPQGCNRIVTNSNWAGQALLFERETLQKILDHRIARDWKGVREASVPWPPHPTQIKNLDKCVGDVCNAMRLPMYFYNPSRAQHIGRHSTLGHGGLGGRRQALYVEHDLRTVGTILQSAGGCNGCS